MTLVTSQCLLRCGRTGHGLIHYLDHHNLSFNPSSPIRLYQASFGLILAISIDVSYRLRRKIPPRNFTIPLPWISMLRRIVVNNRHLVPITSCFHAERFYYIYRTLTLYSECVLTSPASPIYIIVDVFVKVFNILIGLVVAGTFLL